MNWIMIIGIVFITFGTFLTYLGSNYQSNKVSDEIKEKIQMTNDKIEELQKGPGDNKESLNKIDNEFKSWATDFIKNKDSHKYKYEKENLDTKIKEATLSKEWVSFYEYFFESLNSLIMAYNETSSKKILTKISKIPANLYTESAKDFIAKIKFSNDLIWIITLKVTQPFDNNNIPSIEIHKEQSELFDKDIKPSTDFIIWGDLSIIPLPDYSKIRVERSRKEFLTKELKSEYDLHDYKISVKQLLKTIIEFQLTQIN